MSDLDGLVRRLEECSLEKQQAAWGRSDGGQDLSLGAMLADEAAAAIRELQAALYEAMDWNWLDEDMPEDVRFRCEALTRSA